VQRSMMAEDDVSSKKVMFTLELCGTDFFMEKVSLFGKMEQSTKENLQ